MDKVWLYNILISDDVVSSINDNLDSILELIPEIKSMIGFEHNNPHHHLDVWNHTLLALRYSSKDFEVRLVLLLHDIGKPYSYQDGEIRRFSGHPKVSADISFDILNRLNFSDDEIFKLCYLIEQHDTPITKREINDNIDLVIKKFKIQCCDALAHHPSKLDRRIKYLLSINNKINWEPEQVKYRKVLTKFLS